MSREKILRVLAVFFALNAVLATAAWADDEVANPQYEAWSKFAVNSSSTLAANVKLGPVDAHIENTFTLKAISPDEIKLEYHSKVQANGRSNNLTPATRTIKAKAPAKEVKELEPQDVKAVGKTYKCRVIELTGSAAGVNGPKPGRTVKGDTKAVLYVNSDVPGGVVKLEYNGADGKVVTFLLMAVAVK